MATDATLEALAVERLKKLHRERPIVRVSIKGKMTSKELIEEIQKRTKLGRELIANEIAYMKRMRGKG